VRWGNRDNLSTDEDIAAINEFMKGPPAEPFDSWE
jgi:hypothetical protein